MSGKNAKAKRKTENGAAVGDGELQQKSLDAVRLQAASQATAQVLDQITAIQKEYEFRLRETSTRIEMLKRAVEDAVAE